MSPRLSASSFIFFPGWFSVYFLFACRKARGESLARSGWQHGNTDGDKDADAPELNSVLIYSQSASTATPPSTPAGSVDSELFEGRERLLSRSPSKGPNVFTVRRV